MLVGDQIRVPRSSGGNLYTNPNSEIFLSFEAGKNNEAKMWISLLEAAVETVSSETGDTFGGALRPESPVGHFEVIGSSSLYLDIS